MPPDKTALVEGVQIRFRNFVGKATPYNQKGRRNFVIILDEGTANAMAADGWPIKWLEPRDEEDTTPTAILPIHLRYDVGRPPKVVLITSHGRTYLDESTVENLDWADIINADLMIRQFNWEYNKKTGIKAMLVSLYVTIEEDPLEAKYGEYERTSE